MRRRDWLLILIGIALLVGVGVFLLLRFESALLSPPTGPQLVGIEAVVTPTSPTSPTITNTVTLPDSPLPAPTDPLPPTTPPLPTAETIVASSPSPSPTMRREPLVHTVQAGEGLLDIARHYGITAAEIVAFNNLDRTDHLTTGQTLHIPAQPTPVVPTATATATPMLAVTPATADVAAATPAPSGPLAVSGVPVETFLPLPVAVRQHVQAIYAQGQAMGNNPRAFAKLGDSTIADSFFLSAFDTGPYTLGNYAYLQPVIDYFAGSYARESVAVRVGLHSWSVFDPLWADAEFCDPDETVIACEFRLQRPSFLFICLGANDAGMADMFEANLREIVTFSLTNGVIPILGTKADRYEDAANTTNTVIRKVAADYQVPLWDFDLIAETIPGRGLDEDQVHMTVFASHDYTSPLAFQHGHSVHNLTALIALNRVWRSALGLDTCEAADDC